MALYEIWSNGINTAIFLQEITKTVPAAGAEL